MKIISKTTGIFTADELADELARIQADGAVRYVTIGGRQAFGVTVFEETLSDGSLVQHIDIFPAPPVE